MNIYIKFVFIFNITYQVIITIKIIISIIINS